MVFAPRTHPAQIKGLDLDGTPRALSPAEQTISETEDIMPGIHIDNVGDMAVVECEGRFVRSDAAFRLRDAVTSQSDAHVVVLDLTEMEAIGGGVIGMLVFLQRWAYDHDIRFKLFNPVRAVREKLEHASSLSAFEIAGLDEMMALLGHADPRYAIGPRAA
jgi:anti-anti-sigma regulatory factor